MDEQNAQPTGQTYVCMGTCQAVVNEEQFKAGLTACGADACTLHGHPLVPGKKDQATGKNVADASDADDEE